MKNLFALILVFVLSACGVTPEPSVTTPQVAGVDVSHCTHGFAHWGLCASIDWDEGPSADKASAFTVKFWDAASGAATGPYKEPTGDVSSFIQMQCCGSVFHPTVTQTAPGVYSVTDVRFLPGKWKVFVQLKSDAAEEKVFEALDLSR